MLSGGNFPLEVKDNFDGTWTTTKSIYWNSFISEDTDYRILTVNLIEQMLSIDPTQRPFGDKVLHHPFFWDSKRKFEFLNDVAMFIKANGAREPKFIDTINASGNKVFDKSWMAPLDPALQSDLKHRTYKFDSLTCLVRYIRNKKVHFGEEKEQEIKNLFKHSENNVINYFIERFPRLVFHIFDVTTKNNHLFNGDFIEKYLMFNM